ncbi:MAG: flagellar protein FliS [Bryobacteraceae bacterium]|nr:flagellar protein FliS [Bryobacteraceae bacterium]
MTGNPYLQRVDELVHSAEPVQLVCLLTQALCERIAAARVALRAGDIRSRATEISRAIAIVGELAQSLDPSADFSFSLRLQQVYSFMTERLLASNSEQSEAPLIEAHRVAAILADAWSGIESTTVHSHFNVKGPRDQTRLSFCG